MNDGEIVVRVEYDLGAALFGFLAGVLGYGVSYGAVYGFTHALEFPRDVIEAMAATLSTVPAIAMWRWSVEVMRKVAENRSLTTPPKGWTGGELVPVHDWRMEAKVINQPRIYEKNGKGVAVHFLPNGLTYEDLRRVAQAVIIDGCAFSHRALVPNWISRPKMDRLQGWFIERRWAERRGTQYNSPVSLTRTGEYVMERYSHSPTRPASVYPPKGQVNHTRAPHTYSNTRRVG